MFAKLLRFTTIVILLLLLAPFNYSNASCSDSSILCGHYNSVCTTELTCGCMFVYINTCSNGENIGWNICGTIMDTEGYVRISDPVIDDIAPVYLPDGTVITRMINRWSDSEDIPNCDACFQAPTQTPEPPTDTPVPPTFTPVKPTDTPVYPTSTWTAIPPTWTSIPQTLNPTPTLVVPPPTNNAIGQQVILPLKPVNQDIWPLNGQFDPGWWDCGIASLAMELGYFKSQGILDNNAITDYPTIRNMIRGQGDYLFIWKGISSKTLKEFTPILTNYKLETGGARCDEPDQFEKEILEQLSLNRPIIAFIPGKQMGHSIVIFGIQNGNILYIDPSGGKQVEKPIEEYMRENIWKNIENTDCKDDLLIMTFELTTPQ